MSCESYLDEVPDLPGAEVLFETRGRRQGKSQSLVSHFREFKACKEVSEVMGGLPSARPVGLLFPRVEARCTEKVRDS